MLCYIKRYLRWDYWFSQWIKHIILCIMPNKCHKWYTRDVFVGTLEIKLMIWRVKLKLLHCLLIEPRGSICCPSILSRHSIFPLLISKHSMGTCATQLACLRKVCGHVTVSDHRLSKTEEFNVSFYVYMW
jgi:hypothetical protein